MFYMLNIERHIEAFVKGMSRILAAFLVTLIIYVGAYLTETHRISLQPRTIIGPAWVTSKKLKQIQRHHGTIALEITDNTVAIWRKHKWIVVYRDKNAE